MMADSPSPQKAIVQTVQNAKVIGDRNLEQSDEGAVSTLTEIAYFRGPRRKC